MAIPGRTMSCLPWNGARSMVIPALFSVPFAQPGRDGSARRPRGPFCNMGRRSSPSLMTCRSLLISSPRMTIGLVMQAAFAPLALGRPFLAPPGVPNERVVALRKAFALTMADPDFLAEAETMGLGVNAPRTGEQMREVMERVYRTPPRVIDRLRQLNVP